MNTAIVPSFGRATGEMLPTATSKKGNTVGYVSKKAYGVANNLKGAALSRAHLEYRIQLGMAGNVNISTMLTTGQILAQKVTTTNDGFKVAFVHAAKLGVVAADPKAEASKLSDAELLAIVEARKPKAPAAA